MSETRSTGSLRAEGSLDGVDAAALRARLEQLAGDPAPIVTAHDGALYLELHPGIEPARIVAQGRGVSFEARTAGAGPGYHAHLVSLLDALPVRWERVEDASGYYADRTRARLEDYCLDWLGATAAQVLELLDDGATKLGLGLPEGHRYRHDEPVATILGPRSEAWLRAVRADASAGVDAFVWWGEGQDAGYFRGLALAEMWTEVRWRPPLDDAERARLDRVATWVERAHGLDPSIDLPWPEQAELLGYLEEESLRATRARMKAEALGRDPRVGYRRHPVRARLSGGWSLEIDGALAERWDERGTWVAWDESRSIWFTSLSVSGPDGRPSASTEATLAELPALTSDEVLELEAGPLRGIAAFHEEEVEGAPVYRLEAQAAQGPEAALGTLVFVEPSDRQWALETWGSLYWQG